MSAAPKWPESAFPLVGDERIQPEYGMTLRDYFAARALGQMQPWNTDWPTDAIRRAGEQAMRDHFRLVAETAYAYADAMMIARK